MRIYDDLTSWYRLLDPTEDHAEEAAAYGRELLAAVGGAAATLIELGAGAGNNAFYLKRLFPQCTLTDISPGMQALSRDINPECEHLPGDMRTLRLGREFDAVLVHDALCHMTTLDDLQRTMATAFAHTRPGGAALFAPDYVRERFREASTLIGADAGPRSMRGVEWVWDPDPADSQYQVEYAVLLRDGARVVPVTDRYVGGLFSMAEWMGTLESTGFTASAVERLVDEAGQTDRVFVCRRQGVRRG